MAKAAKAAKASKSEAAETASDLPIFFTKPAALDSKRHAKAGFKLNQGYAFANEVNSIPLNVAEFVEAAKTYPVVFTAGEDALPVAVVGLEQKNYFVGEEGQWLPHCYIPAYVRKYPFVFTEMPEQKQFVLCIDEAAPHFAEEAGKDDAPLYDGDKPSELVTRALEFCTAYHNHYVMTRNFGKDLKDAGLLVPHQSDIQLANGRKLRLGSFQLIDAEKFEKLPEEKFLEFRKKGYLPLIYQALMSATNWRYLVDLAGEREPKN